MGEPGAEVHGERLEGARAARCMGVIGVGGVPVGRNQGGTKGHGERWGIQGACEHGGTGSAGACGFGEMGGTGVREGGVSRCLQAEQRAWGE